MFNNAQGFYPNQMVGYSPEAQPMMMTQTLTPEEQSILRKEPQKFSSKLSKEEFLRAICTHKDATTHNIALKQNDDGTHTCAICGETFTLIDLDTYTMDDVRDICMQFNNVFQSVKTMYGSVPPEVGRELYTIGGFIKKFPEMLEYANQYFKRLGFNSGLQAGGYGSNQALQMFQSLMSPGMYAAQGPMPGMMGGAPVNPAATYMAGAPYAAAPGGMPGDGSSYGMMATAPNGMVANYGAGIIGNGVGFVDPSAGVMGATNTETAQVSAVTPDVKSGFKG